MKYKRISAAFHNYADSFASSLNWAHSDYVMSHLLRAAMRSGFDRFEIDLSTGMVSPASDLAPDVLSVIRDRAAAFPQHLKREGLDPARLSDQRMSVEFDLKSVTALPPPGEYAAPYCVTVRARDDRGLHRTGEVRGRWGTDRFGRGQGRSIFERVRSWFSTRAV